METNDIIGAETTKNPLIEGQGARHIRPRPWDMQEKTNPVGAAHLTQETRHGNEMIIMHPDDVVGPQELVDLAGEMFVHPEIGGRVGFRQIGEVEPIMTNRPKRPVSKAAIILFDIAARKVAYRIGERSNSSVLGNVVALLSGFARPAKPEASSLFERCLQRDSKPARRGRRRG